MFRITTTLRIAVGIALLSCSVLLMLRTLHIGPDVDQALLDGRRELAKTIAIHSSYQLSRSDFDLLRQSLQTFVDRNSDIRSIVMTKRSGEIMATAQSARAKSVNSPASPDLSNSVRLPLLSAGRDWGYVEVEFEPLHGNGTLAALSHPYFQMVVFATAANLLLILVYLKRVLPHADPAYGVPDRVRNAFDTISDGLVVLDSQLRIVMANRAFADTVRSLPAELAGKSLAVFRWQDAAGRPLGNSGPWHNVIKTGVELKGVLVRLAAEHEDDTRFFAVNASPIRADDGSIRGTLVSFEDTTETETRRKDLKQTLDVLRTSRDEVRRQNDELRQLGTRDPLTGCLSRRSFYETLDEHWQERGRQGKPLALLMLDVDDFKSINDIHGHSVGDAVLRKVASVLRNAARGSDLVCRYGSEEFFVFMPGAMPEQASAAAERLRNVVAALEYSNFSITASIGVTCSTLGAESLQELIDQADQSLYVAKHRGRNRVECWAPDSSEFLAAVESRQGYARKDFLAQPESSRQDDAGVPYHAVSALLSALSFRDLETAEHSRRVAELCVKVASGIMSARKICILETASLLHDIGKVGVPDAILLKPGPLTAEEWKIMGVHDRMGVEIIASAFSCPALNEIVQNHHAWYSGNSRYPGLPQGEQIPYGARLLAIADAYDAMIMDRVYRKGRSSEEAIQELRRFAGIQFDPQLVERFVAVISDEPRSRTRRTDEVSREAALLIGQRIERLAESLDNHDLPGLAMIAERIGQTARQHGASDLADVASKLEKAAKSDSDLQTIAELVNDLLDLCRATQSAFTRELASDVDETPVFGGDSQFSTCVSGNSPVATL